MQAQPVTTKVHFTVDPAGLTMLAREMWAEGSYDKCLNLLATAKYGEPLPLDVQHDIIRGKKRFALYRNNPDSFCISADRWKPKQFSRYPDPDDLSKLKAQEAEEKRLASKARQFGGYSTLEEANMAMLLKRNLPTVQGLADSVNSRDEREAKGPPKPDPNLTADMGWILPNGKFYGCLTQMEHDWLADQLGFTERQAEKLGWVKISRDILTGSPTILQWGGKDATQKQINTLFDWCQKHNHPLPDWAGGKQ